MKFSIETLNEIKDKISVSQVVEKTVQLKKNGKWETLNFKENRAPNSNTPQ